MKTKRWTLQCLDLSGAEELAEISNEELLSEIPLLTLIGHGFIRRLANQMQAGTKKVYKVYKVSATE